MKKITILTAILMIAFTTAAVAQSTATTTAATSARVITPITITKVVDMNFGNLVATAAGGDIVLPTSGARTGDAAILLGTQNGTVAAASFTVTGETDFTYAITLPSASFDVSNGDTTPATMSVGTFVSSPSSTSKLTSGSETLIVGATITLDANQKSGAYTNVDALAITVNYN
jgi:TRAP-type C4-dicarboxylate transport system substrate-binding protein